MINLAEASPREIGDVRVHCSNCGESFKPAFGTSLWWKLKQYLERNEQERSVPALIIVERSDLVSNPSHCTCEKTWQSEAPYRVTGYDMTCRDFDIPCHTFVQAVTVYFFKRAIGHIAFLHGVSREVTKKIDTELTMKKPHPYKG
ncbi:MAG: hypothetical protein BRC25_02040 [Parcubacteria group bacterium SW_6_46_9]|nr:MAG: hypothetical protein BRC25_02040 [Parcubacteria group bacterium SW_6_46_9]